MRIIFLTVVLLYTVFITNGCVERLTNVAFNSFGRTSGIAVVDLDQDGAFEVIVAVLDGPNMVVKFNQETGKYTDTANEDSNYDILKDPKGMTVSVSACDIDGDGKEEIYLHNINDVYVNEDDMDDVVPDKLLKYDRGRFVDLFSSPHNADLAPRRGGHSVACIDHNGDGMYAFVVTTYSKDGKGVYKMIAMNDSHPDNDVDTGNIILGDISEHVGIDKRAIIRDGRGILVGPIFGSDSRSDMFITNDNSYYIGSAIFRHDSSNVLLHNNGDGTFLDVAEEMGIQDDDENGRGASVGNFNDYSSLDIMYVNFLGPSRLFIQSSNDDNITFKSTVDDLFGHPAPANILLTGYIDNGENLHVLKGGAEDDNIYQTHNEMFTISARDNVTEDSADVKLISFDIGDGELANIHFKGISAADLNGDGLLELIISHRLYGENSLSIYQSETSDSNWIRIFPLTQHGAPARGSKVTLTLDDYTSRDIIIGGGCSYMCQLEPIAHFGLGGKEAREFLVLWPDGHSVRRFLYSKDNRKTLVVTYTGRVDTMQKDSLQNRRTSNVCVLFPDIWMIVLTFIVSRHINHSVNMYCFQTYRS